LALSSPSIQQLADQHADMERAVPFHNATLTPGCGAFAFRPADQALRDRFNPELRDFIGGKTHLELIEPLGCTRESLPVPTAATNKEKTP
jgi:polar amino acid transport system substrate-binding protein